MAHAHAPENGVVGAVYLTRDEIAARVAELGQEIDGLRRSRPDPDRAAEVERRLPRGPDRALRIPHTLDVIELAPYTGGQDGAVRLLKDVDSPLEGRHVLLVEDVVDTGLTLNFLCRTLALRNPASLAAVTLLDRPYRPARRRAAPPLRRLHGPDELFAGYGLGLDERWRALPDLHVVSSVALPRGDRSNRGERLADTAAGRRPGR